MKLYAVQNEWRDTPDATLRELEQQLERNLERDADFVVLPEHVLGDPRRTGAELAVGGRALDILRGIAGRRGVYLVTGSWLERDGERVHNVTRLLDRSGRVVAVLRRPYRPDEPATGDDLPVIDTDKGKVGLLLGHDLWALEASRIQSLRGAQLVLVPGTLCSSNRSSKLSAIWGIATLNCIAVVFAGGTGDGRTGGSTIALPSCVVAQARDRPEIITAQWSDGTMSALREADLSFKNTLWFGLWARRPELYHLLAQEPAPREVALDGTADLDGAA